MALRAREDNVDWILTIKNKKGEVSFAKRRIEESFQRAVDGRKDSLNFCADFVRTLTELENSTFKQNCGAKIVSMTGKFF